MSQGDGLCCNSRPFIILPSYIPRGRGGVKPPHIKTCERSEHHIFNSGRREQIGDGSAIIGAGDIAQEQGAEDAGEFRVFVHLRQRQRRRR